MKARLDAILQRSQAKYLEGLTPRRDKLLARMERLAAKEGHPIADPEVAQFLRVLVRLHHPKQILEIGTNIGYSVVSMGRECGAEAVIDTIEIDPEILSTARGFAEEADLECLIVFHAGAAIEILPHLTGPFDLVFIDCVKSEYESYLDIVLPKLERGAVIVCDNLLWKGKVAAGVHDASTDALRRFNERLMSDPHLVSSILPLGDGTGVSVVV